ncbi:hypothetical protein FB481_106321 [Pseudomonas sp. AG1028]|uniref:hypothetical protein n=1 Tax=Pseudomonas sp. AG1028 TaxID=2572911 RepID=UPI0011ACF346|nr:hypothetical protein [Pseudomonas sp. AG1028]TWE05938.1 hypothetical protein FB481_106321 [Pseudomonas sp. AG1028]
MDLSTLKVMRKVVPGTVFVFFSVPIYQAAIGEVIPYSEALEFPLESYGAVIAFILGTLLCSYNFRSLFIRGSHAKIDKNIIVRLYRIGRGGNPPSNIVDDEARRKLMMIMFYNIIDGDESLKEKGKLVRDNGIVWSTCADIVLLGLIFSWLYFVLSVIASNWYPDRLSAMAVSGLLIGFISLFTSVLVFPKVHSEHLRLSNEQLNVIEKLHRDKVVELFDKNGI